METGVTLLLEEKFQRGLNGDLSGIFLPGTELLQSILGQSLAWDHIRGDIDDPCGAIADFCGVIADFCGVIAIPEAVGGRAGADAATPIVARLAKHHKTLLNIVKHHETRKTL